MNELEHECTEIGGWHKQSLVLAWRQGYPEIDADRRQCIGGGAVCMRRQWVTHERRGLQ